MTSTDPTPPVAAPPLPTRTLVARAGLSCALLTFGLIVATAGAMMHRPLPVAPIAMIALLGAWRTLPAPHDAHPAGYAIWRRITHALIIALGGITMLAAPWLL